MQDVSLIPMWSCITYKMFNYGRIPASSASVEGEFSKIKTLLLKGASLPMRADKFIKLHTNYLSGRLNIVEAKTNENIGNEEEDSTIIAMNEIENWRNKVRSKQRTATYLGQKKYRIKEHLNAKKHQKLTILKNGSHLTLHAIQHQKEKFYVTNTCAFDSIYQIILSAMCDRSLETVRKFYILIEYTNIHTFALV